MCLPVPYLFIINFQKLNNWLHKYLSFSTVIDITKYFPNRPFSYHACERRGTAFSQPPNHYQFWISSSFIFPNRVDKATVILVPMSPICDTVKSLPHLSISSNLWIQSPWSPWSLSWLMFWAPARHAVPCVLGAWHVCFPLTLCNTDVFVTTAIWHTRVTLEGKAQRSFLDQTR